MMMVLTPTIFALKISAGIFLPLLLISTTHYAGAYRIKGSDNESQHFVPYERGSVGNAQQFVTAQTTWSNQGYAESLVLGDSVGKNRLTSCPQMVGPIDNEYFCRGKEYGYCDRRSGTCFCNEGYMGDACEACVPTHFEVGDICYPKKICPNDCSGFGQCNYQTGKCHCNEFREGEDCSLPVCSKFHEFCTTCDEDGCIECEDGFSSHKTAELGEQCQPCWRFDPRCRTCSETACTSCIDLLLLSIHRSGRRPHDPPLPIDELTRELSITVPFGSKQVDAFYDAEHYWLVDPTMAPLNESAVECHQGLDNDDSISCMPYNLTSHRICGNHGTITFDSPEYAVWEDEKHVRLTLRRSGGGVGEVSVSYSLYPISAGFEDVTSTAYYTTNRTVFFQQGQIIASFLVPINDDRIMEPNETFSVHLSNPTGGASIGTQQRTIVTIIDDDSDRTCSGKVGTSLGANDVQTNVGVAGQLFLFDLYANTCNGSASVQGDDEFKVVARKLALEDSHLDSEVIDATGNCALSLENVYTCELNATTSGSYELDVYHLIPGGLKGYYFTDNFLDESRLHVTRIDAVVNFTWAAGPVTTFGRDFVSVRWEGYVRPNSSETYTFWLDVDDHARLWIDGHLLIDWWTFPHASSMLRADHVLSEFETHEIILEYRDILGNATARLLWSSENTRITTIPSSSLFYKEPVRDAPFEFVVLPATTHASQSQVVGLAAHRSIAGKLHSFSIVPKDAFANLRRSSGISNDEMHRGIFRASAVLLDTPTSEGDVIINFDISYDVGLEHFWVSYTPRVSGHYQLDVYHEANGESKPVRGSPFILNVLPGKTFAPECIAVGTVLSAGVAVAGNNATVTLFALDESGNHRDIGGDDWEVTVKSTLTNAYQYGVVQDHGNGTYSLYFVPLISGPNDLSIVLNDSHIEGSPFRINVKHGIAVGQSSFVVSEEEVLTMTAMTTSTFTIQLADEWGNKAITESNLSLVTVQSESIDEHATIISYLGSGRYEISVIPVLTGDIELRILVNEVDINGSPFSISVHPGEFNAEASEATGVGLNTAIAGVESSFVVQSKDAGGNNKVQNDALLNVTLTLVERAIIPSGMEMYAANVTDLVVVKGRVSFVDEGQYLIHYTCFMAGVYDLIVSDYQGNSIAGSPFKIHVSPGQLSGDHSIIVGDGTFKGVAGQLSDVKVFPRDAYQNFIFDSQESLEMSLTLQSRHQSKLEEGDTSPMVEYNLQQVASASNDGAFHLGYITDHAGAYTLDITTFLEGGLTASYYSSPNFSPEHLVFSSIDAAIDTDFDTLPLRCNDSTDCISLSDMSGPFHVGAKWKGKLRAPRQEEYQIVVECNDGGHVRLSINTTHLAWQSCWPHATISTLLLATELDFAFQYKNYEGIQPFVKLKWVSPSIGSVVTIPSSNLLYRHDIGGTLFPRIYPNSVYAPLSNAIGDSLYHAVGGVEEEFLVEGRDRYRNLLLSGDALVVSRGESRFSQNNDVDFSFETSVIDNGNGTFTVHYSANKSGDYLLSVQVSESGTHPLNHVSGSPFFLKVHPASSHPVTSSLTMENNGRAIVGRPFRAQLETKDFYGNIRFHGGNKIVANLYDIEFPTEKYICQVDDDDSGNYPIECPSLWKAGAYLFDVSILNNFGVAEPLTSGPFNVTLVPADANAATTSILTGGTPITTGSGLPSIHLDGEAGVWGSFLLRTKDIFGNPLATGGNHFFTRIDGNNEAEIQVVNQGDNGEYIVAYKVKEASTYNFDIEMATGLGLVAEYKLSGSGSTMTIVDDQIDFDVWELDAAIRNISWTGFVTFPHSGNFDFELTGIEGDCTLHVGQYLVVTSANGNYIGTFDATENVLYEVKINYSPDNNRLLLKMYWSSSKKPREIVPQSHLFNATQPIHGSPFELKVS